MEKTTKVSKQTAGTIGLVAAILYVIGNVIGIGIFFKNGTVFTLNSSNAIGVMFSWIASIVIVLCMALSFAQISTCKTKIKNSGLGGWSEKICGYRAGRFSKITYSLTFWSLNTFIVVFFAGEGVLKCFSLFQPNAFSGENIKSFNFGYGTTAYVFLVGAILFAFFMFLNYFAKKTATKFGSIISSVKFVPILMVIILGITFGIIYANGGLWVGNQSDGSPINKSPFNIVGSISAIPAILFAYESYISVGNISADIKNSERNLPLSVVLSVIIISVLYLAVTIGCVTAGTGNVYELFETIKSKNINLFKALTSLISIFIFISLIGSVNGLSKGGSYAVQSLCEDGVLFKSKALLSIRNDGILAGTIGFAIMVFFWWALLIIPSSILNIDAIVDGSSTSLMICVYIVYFITVLGGLINVKTKKVEVKKINVFPFTAIIGLLGCLLMIIFVCFVQFFSAPIINGLRNLDGKDGAWLHLKSGWGMFVNAPNCLAIKSNPNGNGYYVLSNIEIMWWFWGLTILLISIPFINDLLIKYFDKQNNQILIWQSVEDKQKIF